MHAPKLTREQIMALPALIDLHTASDASGLSLRWLQAEAKRGNLAGCAKIGRRYLVNSSKFLASIGLGE